MTQLKTRATKIPVPAQGQSAYGTYSTTATAAAVILVASKTLINDTHFDLRPTINASYNVH